MTFDDVTYNLPTLNINIGLSVTQPIKISQQIRNVNISCSDVTLIFLVRVLMRTLLLMS